MAPAWLCVVLNNSQFEYSIQHNSWTFNFFNVKLCSMKNKVTRYFNATSQWITHTHTPFITCNLARNRAQTLSKKSVMDPFIQYSKWIKNIVPFSFTNKQLGVQMLLYPWWPWMADSILTNLGRHSFCIDRCKSNLCELFTIVNVVGNFWIGKICTSGKFAPQENSPLYSNLKTVLGLAMPKQYNSAKLLQSKCETGFLVIFSKRKPQTSILPHCMI